MNNRKRCALLLAATAILGGNCAPPARADDWPGNEQPRLEVVQKLVNQAGPGQPFYLELSVRNLGAGAARSVQITDKLPRGAELLDASPAPARDQSTLTWSLATLKGGGELRIRLRLRSASVPGEGEWLNKVRVDYQVGAGNAYAIQVERPKLGLDVRGGTCVMLGEELPVEVDVTNAGTWTGHRLHLTALMSGGLAHAAGTQLENDIGDLPVGQVCKLPLSLKTLAIGQGRLQLRLASAETNLIVRNLTVVVCDGQVDLAVRGPSTVSAGWACTYDFIVTNRGKETLPATRLTAELPRNLSFSRASGNGAYLEGAHAVSWTVPPCKPGESVTCVLGGVALDVPSKEGSLKLLHNKFLIKSTPFSISLLEKSGAAVAH
jgi:hypothetical protein